MIPPQILIGGGAVLLLLGTATGWTVRDWKADSDALEATQAADKQFKHALDVIGQQATGFETFRQSLEPQRTKGRDIITKEYHDVPVPADCALRPATLGVLEQARQRANAAATGQPGKPMPSDSPDASDRP